MIAYNTNTTQYNTANSTIYIISLVFQLQLSKGLRTS